LHPLAPKLYPDGVSRGGFALGGTPRKLWGAGALAIAAAFMLGASSAWATTDRDDYDAQVNPICASANIQSEQLGQAIQQTYARLKRKASKVHGRKRDKLERRLDALFFDYSDQNVAVYLGEIARLRQVSPAPGDEALVSDWLSARQSTLDLTSQENALSRREDRLFTRTFEHTKSLRQFIKAQKRLSILDRQIAVLQSQLEPIYRQNVELGAKLGAAYCVSEATGAA
jgi:hypothetical protein